MKHLPILLALSTLTLAAAPTPPKSTSKPASTKPTTSKHASTNPASKPAYTLGNDNDANLAQNPSPDLIKSTLAALDGNKVLAVYLHQDATHALQANYVAENQLTFQYVGGDDQHQYHTTKTYPRETAVQLFLSYMTGRNDWQKMVAWQPMKQ